MSYRRRGCAFSAILYPFSCLPSMTIHMVPRERGRGGGNSSQEGDLSVRCGRDGKVVRTPSPKRRAKNLGEMM